MTTDTIRYPLPPLALSPATVAEARAGVYRSALRNAWAPAELAEVLDMLGLTPTLAPTPATPVPPTPDPTPAPGPDPATPSPWYDALDVIDEAGINRGQLDSGVRSGYVPVAGIRQPGGVVVPAAHTIDGRGRGTRQFTRGGIAIACRIAHLAARWRHPGGPGLTLADCAAIATAGHAADLPTTLAARLDWAAIATAARDDIDARPDCTIWRDALYGLAVRAAAIHEAQGRAQWRSLS